jgi:CRP-like cAMP-binding protein
MAKTLRTNLLDDNIINVLKKFMIFESLFPAQIRRIFEMESRGYRQPIAKLTRYEPGEAVIREGEFDCWSFWVVKGAFEVVQEGRPIVDFSTPGEIFGEMSVLEGIPRTASVISKTRGVCLGIDMSVIENMEDAHIRETIKKGFYKVILKRLEKTKNKIDQEKKKLESKYSDLLDFEKRILNRTKGSP